MRSFPSPAAKSLQSCLTLCDPHRQQPTRFPRSWDSPGKNTGVGCHFLLQCMKVKSESEVTLSCLTLSNPNGLQPTRLLHPWDFPGKSTGVSCHCVLHPISYFSEFLQKALQARHTYYLPGALRQMRLREKVTQLVRGGTKIWTQVCATPKLTLVFLSEETFQVQTLLILHFQRP